MKINYEKLVFIMNVKNIVLITLAIFVVVGCTHVPVPIREVMPESYTINQVRIDFSTYIGKRVRWGGTIQRLVNKKQETILEIVAYKLSRTGRPIESDKSEGRFLIRIKQFLEPAIYEEGRQITVIGTIESSLTRDIGEYNYIYPQLVADTFYLWELVSYQPVYYYNPFWYDPWYPWYSYGYLRWHHHD